VCFLVFNKERDFSRVVSLKLFISVLVVVIIVLSMLGFYVYTLVGVNSELGVRVASLSSNYSLLNTQYESLLNNYTSLTNNYTLLNARYSSLEVNYSTLKYQYDTLFNNYTMLKSSYELLKTQYEQLLNDYETLKAKYNASVSMSKPVIKVKYTPTKVVNDKIYDLRIEIEAEDNNTPIANATLKFIPIEYEYFITKYGMKPEDYPKAFPPDKERIMNLIPLDGKFDELKEEFEADIKDIIGGREYKIVVIVKNLAGNENTVEIKTPYIRQFENIAKQDNITVVAFYYNWYTEGYNIPYNLPDPPLLGFYDSHDNIVFNKHVDWATGHGIDVFLFPYPYHSSKYAFTWLEEIFKENMKAELFDQIKFSFCSTFVDNTAPRPPYNFDDPRVKQEFIDNINYIKDYYAKLPNFWRIDGKPVIVIWNTPAYLSKEGNVADAMRKVGARETIFLIGDIYGTGKPVFEWYNTIDGIAPYIPIMGLSDSVYSKQKVELESIIDEVIKNSDEWRYFLEKYNIKFFYTVAPGFNDTPNYTVPYHNNPIVLRSESSWRKFIDSVLKIDDVKRNKIIFLTSFNEWFETTAIEPSRGYGFAYLKILKEELYKFYSSSNSP